MSTATIAYGRVYVGNADGYVYAPDVDPVAQMVNLISASRGYQAGEPQGCGLVRVASLPPVIRRGSGFVHPVQTPFWGGR